VNLYRRFILGDRDVEDLISFSVQQLEFLALFIEQLCTLRERLLQRSISSLSPESVQNYFIGAYIMAALEEFHHITDAIQMSCCLLNASKRYANLFLIFQFRNLSVAGIAFIASGIAAVHSKARNRLISSSTPSCMVSSCDHPFFT
jgi:hypothetical protein